MVAAPDMIRSPHRIAVLPREVAERIAAGEVVERPSSVVRELLDNAIDAGASEISVELRGGGLELIRVSDNGEGILPDDVELAFQRHATSKLGCLEDLSRLETLGFRGEALPSIAAVSEVTMLSRAAASDAGFSILIRGGTCVQRGAAARQVGTTVTVRRLFFNVPARLKFLPTSRHESVLVSQLVRRYTLAHPELRLTLVQDGHLSFRSGGSGRLDRAISEVYGSQVAQGMLSLGPMQAGRVRLFGRVGGRTVTRPGRAQQTLVVNGRCVTNHALFGAIEAAYRPLLPRGRHPITVIVIEAPPEDLDQNVHPTKSEVRLFDERPVAEALAAAIRATYAHLPAVPSTDDDFALVSPQLRFNLAGRVAESRGPSWRRNRDEPAREVDFQKLRLVGQLHESLVVAESDRGLYLIDQHRAHERAIFERLSRDSGRPSVDVQALLEPVVLEIRPHEARVLAERLVELERLGFECEQFGGRAFLVRGVPALPGVEDFISHLPTFIEEATAEGERWDERLLTAVACRAAVRRERRLSISEMEQLVAGLADTSAPAVCPHGSPLILHLSGSFLERQFDW